MTAERKCLSECDYRGGKLCPLEYGGFCTEAIYDSKFHPANIDPTNAALSCEMADLYEKPAIKSVQNNGE